MTSTATARALVVRDTDDPPLSGDTRNGRFYRLTPNGPLVYPSITNIKGVKNSDALNGWKVKMTANKAMEWLTWLGHAAKSDPDKALAAIEDMMESPYRSTDWLRTIKRAHRVHSDTRAARGSQVHIAVEQILTGREVTANAPIAPVTAFRQFFADFDVVPVEVEVTVVNHTHRYAGTGDLLAHVGGPEGPLAMIDWKSRDSIMAETALQLSALAHGEFILRADGTQEPYLRPTLGVAVALGDDGRYHAHKTDISAVTFAQFCGARALFDFDPRTAMSAEVTSAAALV